VETPDPELEGLLEPLLAATFEGLLEAAAFEMTRGPGDGRLKTLPP
jgi:hypothetical protein